MWDAEQDYLFDRRMKPSKTDMERRSTPYPIRIGTNEKNMAWFAWLEGRQCAIARTFNVEVEMVPLAWAFRHGFDQLSVLMDATLQILIRRNRLRILNDNGSKNTPARLVDLWQL